MPFPTTGGVANDEEYRRQSFRRPMVRSLILHVAVAALLIGYGLAHKFFHGNEWGSKDFQQGAIQATMVNTVALPLPQDHAPTDNVLATKNPSEAPELEKEKAAPIPVPNALPVPEKKPEKKKEPRRSQQKAPPQPEPKPQQHKARYGEATPANLPKATANNPNASNSVAQTGGNFGSRFGWYVDIIKRRVAQNWYLQEVEPSTPAGATVYVRFAVKRDGSPTDVRLAASSGIPSLDSSCERAIERVQSFGSLPAGYNQSSLDVLYHCTYPGRQ